MIGSHSSAGISDESNSAETRRRSLLVCEWREIDAVHVGQSGGERGTALEELGTRSADDE